MKCLLLMTLIAVGILVAIVSLFMVARGASWIKGYLMTEEGGHFKVPADALPLQQVELRASSEVITVCNRVPNAGRTFLFRSANNQTLVLSIP
jgi:hypothetical protein